MLLGLISDTHDNLPALDAALNAFRSRRVTHVLHAGDITTAATLERLRGWQALAVYGNNDVDRTALAQAARSAGIELADGWEGALEGTRIAVIHGDNGPRVKGAIASGRFDLVVTGHSHMLRDERNGGTRVINPGALHRAARYTCASYDPSEDTLEVIDVKLLIRVR